MACREVEIATAEMGPMLRRGNSKSALDSSDTDSSEYTSGDDDNDNAVVPRRELEEDIFSLAIMSAVRDVAAAGKREDTAWIRYMRLAVSLGLVFGNLIAQAGLIWAVKRYVTLPAVLRIRKEYDVYVKHLYGNDTVTYEGQYVRGIPGTVHANGFSDLDSDLQETICSIPLSQPLFLMTILTIWTLTCLGEIRKCYESLRLLVYRVPTLDSMDASIVPDPEDKRQRMIQGLTRSLKALLTLILVLRFLLVCLLLWVGCRWLTATPSFEDVLLNGIALEFILLTRELLYRTVVTERSKMDVQTTSIRVTDMHPVTLYSFLGSTIWLFLAVFWVIIYVHYLQHVIPYYGWDVAEVCNSWLDRTFPASTLL
eukprot:TRINITY_DN4308_c0_g1_i1.p1 TRINITY_DN4308_c0_g1~~TRINITY_DN4308_c0_g1_i1.p1  ORF type:complete len:369 (+),score=54.34 TRINITY_DN4308_c0_g1_i1:57-1163(+)